MGRGLNLATFFYLVPLNNYDVSLANTSHTQSLAEHTKNILNSLTQSEEKKEEEKSDLSIYQ